MTAAAYSQPVTAAYNATAVLNQYIAYNAPKTPAWQRDIVIEQGNIQEVAGRVLPPRKVGVSNVCGVYSYRPVTWGELSKSDKLSVLQDPNLMAWISWYKAQGRVTVPSNIGTPLPQKTAQCVNPGTTPAPKPQVALPPIEQTPYYQTVQNANSNAIARQTEKQTRDYNEYLLWKQQMEQLKQHGAMGAISSQQIPQRIGYDARTPNRGYIPQPTQYTESNTVMATAQANSPYYGGNQQPANMQNRGYAGIPQISQKPYVGQIQPPEQQIVYNQQAVNTIESNIADSPEYRELMHMRQELLNESPTPGYYQPQAQPTQMQQVSPDMGKYQINVSPAELYSPNPVYYNLKPSR